MLHWLLLMNEGSHLQGHADASTWRFHIPRTCTKACPGVVRNSACARMQVLHELTVIANDTTVAELTAHALQASIGELCMRGDRAAIAALAANLDKSPAGVVQHYSPLIISHGLWQAGSSAAGLQSVDGGMIRFLEELVAEGASGAL